MGGNGDYSDKEGPAYLPVVTLRFNAEQLWRNLIKQGWQRVPPQ